MGFACCGLLRICYGWFVILSSYERKDSPYVWAQVAAGRGEKKRYIRLDVRKDDPAKSDLVRIAMHRLEGELLAERALAPCDPDSTWGWVPGFIATRWGAESKTGRVYSKQWVPLLDFLSGHRLLSPSALAREDCFAYVAWRTAQEKARSGRMIAKNTALGELKLLAMLMDEAVLRGLAAANPCRRLKIAREEVAEKPEITADEEQLIRSQLLALPKEDAWMAAAFHVAISTGLRIGECRIAAHQVRWAEDQILIERPKGGRRREFCIPIYESIRPDLLRMRAERRRALFDVPADKAGILGIVWRRFFDGIGLPHICFHCTRVTFVTRGMRAGVPEAVMMRMVNHGSSLINRVYQRWTSDDVRHYAGLLAPAPAAAGATGENQRPTPSARSSGTRGAWRGRG